MSQASEMSRNKVAMLLPITHTPTCHSISLISSIWLTKSKALKLRLRVMINLQEACINKIYQATILQFWPIIQNWYPKQPNKTTIIILKHSKKCWAWRQMMLISPPQCSNRWIMFKNRVTQKMKDQKALIVSKVLSNQPCKINKSKIISTLDWKRAFKFMAAKLQDLSDPRYL